MRNEKAKIFDSILNTIENEDIRHFAEECIETIPDYFWEVGASSTGKYHPQYALGELGLARHTCALVKFLNHILNVDCFGDKFTSREKDLMRVAGMMHDTRKSGEKLVDVAQSDLSYISWAKENMSREPVKSLLAQL